jgi:hypothetical protein
MTVPEPIYYEHKPDKNLVKLQQRQRQEQQDNFNANNDLSLLISTLDQELSGVVNDGANSQFINDQISSVAVRPGFKVKQMESSASLDYTGIIMTNAINCSNSAAASGSNTESGSIMDFNQPLLHAHSMSAAVLPALETVCREHVSEFFFYFSILFS